MAAAADRRSLTQGLGGDVRRCETMLRARTAHPCAPLTPEPDLVLYEFPFNEGIRTMLRLEHLFDRLGQLVPRDAPVDHHFALATIFEIMDVASRADLKSDLLKELDRYRLQLQGYRGHPGVALPVLDGVMGRIDRAFSGLNALQGKAGQVLTGNDWLMSIRSRINIPGGTCEFDLPAYFAWQHRAPELRQADLQGWVQTLTPLADAIVLLMKMLRDSGSPQKVVAPGGQLQQNLPPGRTFHLLRLSIDPVLGLLPEISGNRLMMSVRLMRQGADHRLHPAAEDAAFELTLCS